MLKNRVIIQGQDTMEHVYGVGILRGWTTYGTCHLIPNYYGKILLYSSSLPIMVEQRAAGYKTGFQTLSLPQDPATMTKKEDNGRAQEMIMTSYLTNDCARSINPAIHELLLLTRTGPPVAN